MADRILFLGTSGDEVVTSKQVRASGGIIINTEGYQFHLDPGPGTLVQAKKHNINLRETTAVLVSHSHINHCNDINVVLAAMSHNKLDVKGILIANNTLVNRDEKTKPYLTEFHKGCVEKTITPEPGQKIGIEDIEIIALKSKHTDPKTIGFKFITPKFTLVYSSDTGYHPDLMKEYANSDILILNVVHSQDKKDSYNLNSEDAINIIKRVKPNLAILSHFGKSMIEANPVYKAREIYAITQVQTIAAEDGTSIDPSQYASKTRQKKLESFEGPEITEE